MHYDTKKKNFSVNPNQSSSESLLRDLCMANQPEFIDTCVSDEQLVYLYINKRQNIMARQLKNRDEAEVTFGDVLYEKRYRKAQNDFLNQIDQMIDWRPIRTLINKKYTKSQDTVGASAYAVALLFKMLLLETWYNLSEVALEERVNDSISFSRFLGLKMENVSPDHSTISRFRNALTELKLMDALMRILNKQLSKHHISISEGLLVDASIVDTPHKPNGRITIEVAEDREDTRSDEAKKAEEE